MNSGTCPVCGSSRIKKGTRIEEMDDPFGGKVAANLVEYTCENCGALGDFSDENEAAVDAAAQVLKEQAVDYILGSFASRGLSFSSVERLLGLPQRTLTKWKSKSTAPHAAGVTLLKYVHLFPWLLEVAEGKFDENLAQKIHIQDAVGKLLTKIRFDESRTFILSHDRASNVSTLFMSWAPGAQSLTQQAVPTKLGNRAAALPCLWRVEV